VDAIVYCKPGAVSKPIDKSRPVIKGKTVSGRKLTASKGRWTSTTLLTYKYQWVSCNKRAKKCKSIRGAIKNTLKLGPKDVGHRLEVVITARNAAGSAKAASKLTSIVKK
jgi:regulatory protein YycI of two-component signal transduction system YycFG